ncbi:MAG: GH3 auxin-responsive promoter family protein [Chlorobi bacterium]|nr:GH3 auxin-responsive promoter family protein [Chlorobiota bacterium]
MTIISSVLNWLMKKRIHQIELFKKYPNEVQEELLKKLINTSRNTYFGKKYDYKSIKSTQEFKQRVPISTYEDIKSYIDRLRNGEENILWPGEIIGFAKSSGTTDSKSKFIPVSEDSLINCHYKGGKDMLSIYFNLVPGSKLFEGKSLVMGGSGNIQEVSNTSYYEGDLSAILMNNLPFWAEFMRTPSLSIALMDEWENKLELMVESTLNHDVTSLSGVPSWMLVLIRKILEKGKIQTLDEVWPNLEVFFHGGVNFEPYRPQYESIIKSAKMQYFNTYNASEGFFGIQDQLDSDDILLMLDYGIFYEFIPVSDLNNKEKAISLSEVELGVNYAMVITTNAGLWRYEIGDTVCFTSISPYRLSITGRTKNFINIVGEELIIDNAEKALNIACRKTSSTINEYTAAPLIRGEDIFHEWIIEFDIKPHSIEYFTETFDNALKSLNSDYEAKRYHSLVLKEPVITSAPRKTFYNWMKKREKLGGQNKVPRLSNNRIYVDELLEMYNFADQIIKD